MKTSCSLAIRLIDAYTGQAPLNKGLRVQLDGTARPPVVKPDGMLIYNDLPEGEYMLRLSGPCYHPTDMPLYAGRGDPYVTAPLIPNSAYPFPGHATLIRAAFRDTEGRPLPGVRVIAVCRTPQTAAAQLAVGLEEGADQATLANMRGQVRPGDHFLLSDHRGKTESDGEYCKISREVDGTRTFFLHDPIRSAYAKGALLLPAYMSVSDQTGEAVIPFRNPPSRSFSVELAMEWKEFSLIREVEANELQTSFTGTIRFEG